MCDYSLLNLIKWINCKGGETMAFKCGQKPGVGRYVCLGCGEDLYLDNSTDTLPPCAKCSKCEFRRG